MDASTKFNPSATDDGHAQPGDDDKRAAVLELVRTPFSVRRNIVKVWRPLPFGLWTALSWPQDHARAVRVERQAMAGIAVMAVALVLGFAGIGFRAVIDGQDFCFPLLGWAQTIPAGEDGSSGWMYRPGQSLSLVLWTVGPSLVGWASMRLLWIPAMAAKRAGQGAALTFARHLGSVYLYVYVMIVVGASIMPLLILVAPRDTEFFRWCLWCFLFGESFFVPGVMWSRLILHDTRGEVFGRHRLFGLGLYLVLFVVCPIVGMVGELR